MSSSTSSHHQQNLSLQKLVNQLGSGLNKTNTATGGKQAGDSRAVIEAKAGRFGAKDHSSATQATTAYQQPQMLMSYHYPNALQNPSTASIDADSMDKKTEKMVILSQMDHQSMNSAQTVPQVHQQFSLRGVGGGKDQFAAIDHSVQAFSTWSLEQHQNQDGSMHHLSSSQDRSTLSQKQDSTSAGAKNDSNISTVVVAVVKDTVPSNRQESSGHTAQDPNNLLTISRQTTNQSMSSSQQQSTNNIVRNLKVQSQQVSLATGNRLAGGSATPNLLTKSDASNLLETSRSTSKLTAQTQQAQAMITTLEQKVSSLVLKMEMIRPMTKEAQRIIDAKSVGSGGLKTTRVTSIHRSSSRGKSQVNNATNETAASARGKSNSASTTSLSGTTRNSTFGGSQTHRLPRKKSQSRTTTDQPTVTITPQQQSTQQSIQNNSLRDLTEKVEKALKSNEDKMTTYQASQTSQVQAQLNEQVSRVNDCEHRLASLLTKLEEKELAKKARKEKRRKEKQTNALEALRAQLVESVVSELKLERQKEVENNTDPLPTKVEQGTDDINVGEAQEEEAPMCLDPATRDYIQQQLDRDSYISSSSQSQSVRVRDEKGTPKPAEKSSAHIGKVITIDLEQSVTSNPTASAAKAGRQFTSAHHLESDQSIEITAARSVQDDKDVKEEESLPTEETDTKETKNDLPMAFQGTSTSSLQQIRLALEKLEAYSLRSSEDINDSIEQLVSCFNSNTSALQRALDDLKHKRIVNQNSSNSADNLSEKTVQSVYDIANKILFQFENFAQYTKSEVTVILNQLEERRQECMQSLNLLQTELLPAQELHCQKVVQTREENIQFEASKEHIQALSQHIQNTQQFLQRETNQIESKIGELQSTVVKDIESIFLHLKSAEGERGLDGRSSIASAASPTTTSSAFAQQNNKIGKGHRHTLSQELPGQQLPAHGGQGSRKPMLGQTQASRHDLAHLILSSCSPSKQSSRSREEVSILSPQELGVLRSQISTIPEEEDLDQAQENQSNSRYCNIMNNTTTTAGAATFL